MERIMNEPSREQKLEAILHAYLQAADAGQQPDREELFRHHPDLVGELREFFADQEKMERFGKSMHKAQVGDATIGSDGSPDNETSPPRIRYFGDYELLEEIARGGMGVVYKARQVSLNRVVAIKMILAGQLASDADVQRYRAEAEAAANLDHPNIVPIYEIGDHEGQQYFSMKLIEGGSLAGKIAEFGADPRRAAQLMATIAGAVHYAHRHGILHRDLKPANILLDAHGQPLVTDFGLAKRVECESELTRTGAIVGTPCYMAPEQAAAQKGLSTAADVYSLGAILYELLTGRPPFRGADVLATLFMVANDEPPRPRSLNRRIDRDLETICLKCLQKAPGKRYGAAAELADDLSRFLKGESIQARPVNRLERTWRWCRRKPLVASLLALIALVAVTGAGAVLHQLDRAVTAEGNLQHKADDLQIAVAEKTDAEKKVRKKATDLEEANKELDKAYKNLEAALQEAKKQKVAVERRMYAGNIALAQAAWQEFDPPLALRQLHNCRKEFRGWEYDYLSNQFNQPTTTLQAGAPVTCVAYSPDQKWIVGTIGHKFVKVWDASNGKEIHSFKVDRSVARTAFSPDSKQLVGDDGKTIKLWDVLTGKVVRTFTGHTGWAYVAFSPNGKQIYQFNNDDRTLTVLDPVTGQSRMVKELKSHPAQKYAFQCAAFSKDGKQIVTLTNGEKQHTIDLWDSASGEKLRTLKGQRDSTRIVAFSPDGKRIVIAGSHRTVGDLATVWDVATEAASATFKGRNLDFMDVAFSPDGKQIVTGSVYHTLKLWDATTGQEIFTLQGHVGPVHSVAFRRDGKQIVSGGGDGTLKLWDAVNGQNPSTFHHGFAHSRDGRWAVSTEGDKFGSGSVLQVRDTVSRRVISTFKGHGSTVDSAVFSPDAKWIASRDLGSKNREGVVKVWNASTGQEIRSFMVGVPLDRLGFENRVLAFSPDGKWIVASSNQEADPAAKKKFIEGYFLKIWDRESGREIHTLKGPTGGFAAVAFSPDGKRFVTVRTQVHGVALEFKFADPTLTLWDAVTGKEIRTFKAQKEFFASVAFSLDGKRIVTGGMSLEGERENGTLKVWDAATGEEVLALKGLTDFVACVAFSPDGNRIVSGVGKWVRVWDAESGQETITLKGHTDEVVSVSFSPDGRRIFSRVKDGGDSHSELKVWDAHPQPPWSGPGAK
jgi:WD40 repeat protein/tRNA A-37 threonylcarbamoyl transferase component Bud32